MAEEQKNGCSPSDCAGCSHAGECGSKPQSLIKPANKKSHINHVSAVVSGKGGVGKSNLSVNLALELTRMGKKVIILDADFGLANVEVMFGVIPEYNLSDLMFKGKEIKDIITEGPEGVGFISGGSGIANLINLDQEQVKRLVGKMTDLEELADVIIIDTGAGIAPSVMEFLLASPETIIVTTPEPTSVTDSYALLKALSMNEGYNKEECSIKMVANRVESESEGRNLYEKLNAVVTKFLGIKLSYLGSVPQDSNVRKAVMKQKPVTIMYPSSSAARHFKNIAAELLGNDITVPAHRMGIRSYFKNVFSRKM